MKLFVFVVLVLGLTWTRVEPRPGPGYLDCSVVKPALTLEDKTPVLGRFHYIKGFADSKFYKTFLGMTSSFWVNLTETSTGLHMNQYFKMNGKCGVQMSDSTIEGNTTTVVLHNMTSRVQVFKLSSNSFVVRARTTANNVHELLRLLTMDPTGFDPDLNALSMYLTSRDPVVSDSDLQQFSVYAQCAGFSGDPDYSHDPKNEFCLEEESVLMTL